MLNKNIKFNKNEMDSKLENLTHIFRDMSHVLQLLQELQIKSKIDEMEFAKGCIAWMDAFSVKFILSGGIFFNISVSSECIVY